MTLVHGLHLVPLVEFLSALGGGCTFLYGCYHQLRRAANAVVDAKDSVVRRVNEHDEVYDWFSTHVKTKRKANGVRVH